MKTKDKDLGYRKYLKTFNSFKGGGVHVDTGYFEEDIHKSTSDRKKPMTVVEIATIHEFGDKGNVPQRSFMGSSFDSEYKKWNYRLSNSIYRMPIGKISVHRILGVAGGIMERSFKHKIGSGDPSWPALHPITIKKKGFSDPLIETRQMLNSIKSRFKAGSGKPYTY
jgi:hypothetical protein